MKTTREHLKLLQDIDAALSSQRGLDVEQFAKRRGLTQTDVATAIDLLDKNGRTHTFRRNGHGRITATYDRGVLPLFRDTKRGSWRRGSKGIGSTKRREIAALLKSGASIADIVNSGLASESTVRRIARLP